MSKQKAHTARIAILNDLARTAMGVASKVYQTQSISALPEKTQSAIREAVEGFNAFTPDNDPYGERDFGSFVCEGERCFWKIDYYDAAMEFASTDPTDAKLTQRVLTIGLMSDY